MNLIDIKSLKCPGCGAPYSPGQKVCGFCSTPIPQSTDAEQLQQGSAMDGTEEVVDYYALIGLSQFDQPNILEIAAAAMEAQQRHMFNKFMSKEERQQHIEQVEIARWVLSDDRARREYDGILQMLRNGIFNDKHLGMLGALQQRARRELGLVGEANPAELLQQGAGYQTLGMHLEAVAVLKKAVEAMPDSGEAHYRYAQALLSSESPLSKGPHDLRQAVASFKAAAQLDPSLASAPAYEALCQGLLARQSGDLEQARAELLRAASLDDSLGAAWMALAALALHASDHQAVLNYCRRALTCDASDEQTYLLLLASCWRSGQRERAHDVAARIAALRGAGWNARKVLQDFLAYEP